MEHKIPYELSDKLQANPIIRKRLISVIWFGSIRNKQDVHERSDYDMQIILSKPSAKLTLELNKILQAYSYIDLSIMYKQDIFDLNNNVIFHDGTKGLFFIYVLSEGKVIYGDDIYSSILKSMSISEVRSSILTTIREYLSRLRVMAAFSPNDTMQFKKYSLKLFKDILIYRGKVPLKNMSSLKNGKARDMIMNEQSFSKVSVSALESITDYEHNFSSQELASLLNDFEKIVYGVVNE